MSFLYDITNGVETGCVGEQSTDPKGNVTLKIYDKAGRLYKVTADGGTTEYSYYLTGNRKSITYPSGAKEEYTYYNDGLLKELKNKKANGSVMDDYTYTYDAAHNQLTKHEIVNSVNKGTTSYMYDSLNRLETVTESGKTTSYTFDKAGNRLCETVIAGQQTVVTTYTYNEQNRLLNTITQSSNETEKTTYKYDNNGNMLAKDRVVTKSVPSGNVTGVSGYILGKAMGNYGTIYRYDDWNQLTKAVEKDKTVIYSYNGEGYMTEKSVNGSLTRLLYEGDKVVLETNSSGEQTARNIYGTNILSRTTGGETLWYMYNGHADVTALIGGGAELLANGSFTESSSGWWLHVESGTAIATGTRDTSVFDSSPTCYKISCTSSGSSLNNIQFLNTSGNSIKITAGKTYKLTFRAKSIGGNITPMIKLMKNNTPWTSYTEYQEVTIGSTWSTYVLDFTPNTSDDIARFCFYLGGRIPDGGILYLDSFSFKEVGVSSDIVTATYYYDAFGNIVEETGGTWFDNPNRYAGYQYDTETGLYYLNARYYDSKIARFLSEDTYTGDPTDPLSLNLYTYCHNEPIMYTDPTGHWAVGDSDRSPEVQAQILEATRLYDEAKRNHQSTTAAEQMAKDARNGVIYRSDISETSYSVASDMENILNSKYVSKDAKNDIKTSDMATISNARTDTKYQTEGAKLLHSINTVRKDSNDINPQSPTGLYKNSDFNYSAKVQQTITYYNDIWLYANTANKLGILNNYEKYNLQYFAVNQVDEARYAADHPILSTLKTAAYNLFDQSIGFLPGGESQEVGDYYQTCDNALSKIGDSKNYALIIGALSAKTHVVYTLRDSITDEVKYVGRTMNPSTREINHALSEDKGHLVFKIEKEGLSYSEARGMEQILSIIAPFTKVSYG